MCILFGLKSDNITKSSRKKDAQAINDTVWTGAHSPECELSRAY